MQEDDDGRWIRPPPLITNHPTYRWFILLCVQQQQVNRARMILVRVLKPVYLWCLYVRCNKKYYPCILGCIRTRIYISAAYRLLAVSSQHKTDSLISSDSLSPIHRRPFIIVRTAILLPPSMHACIRRYAPAKNSSNIRTRTRMTIDKQDDDNEGPQSAGFFRVNEAT